MHLIDIRDKNSAVRVKNSRISYSYQPLNPIMTPQNTIPAHQPRNLHELENGTGKIHLPCLTLLSSALIFPRKSPPRIPATSWVGVFPSPFQGVTSNVQRSPGDSLGVSGMVLVLREWEWEWCWCWCLSERMNRFSN